MGIIRNLLNKSKENKEEFKQKLKEAQADYKIQELIRERSMSSDERELESHLKQKREDGIKKKLEVIHKQKNKELWKSDKTILDSKMTILKEDRPILKERHIFMNNKNTSKITKNRMFFK